MTSLVLELRPGETLRIGGASVRFRTKARVELTEHVRFLFGKQIMAPEDATTPARRLYLALQEAYIGDRERGLADARVLAAAIRSALTSMLARDILDRAVAAAEADECYTALKLARRIIRHEDGIAGALGEETGDVG